MMSYLPDIVKRSLTWLVGSRSEAVLKKTDPRHLVEIPRPPWRKLVPIDTSESLFASRCSIVIEPVHNKNGNEKGIVAHERREYIRNVGTRTHLSLHTLWRGLVLNPVRANFLHLLS